MFDDVLAGFWHWNHGVGTGSGNAIVGCATGATKEPPLRPAFDRRIRLEFHILDRVDVVLQHDLLGGVVKADRAQPAPIRPGPTPHAAIDPVRRDRSGHAARESLAGAWRALASTRKAVARARTRSRMASCAASGIQTGVR
jgi:hypothetical protein